jgi:peptide/nickel transport system permease protein
LRLRSSLLAIWQPLEGKLGIAILAAFVMVMIFGPTLAPYGPAELGAGPPTAGVSLQHPFGTDQLGRDVLSRILYGGRSVIAAPLLATVLAFLLGGIAGMVAGYRGGRVDIVATRVVDVLISLPPLLMILVIVAAVESSTPVLVIAVALVFAPRVARILRGATQGAAGKEYIQAAQARGERTLYIVLREILPNIAATAFVEFAVRLAWAIIFFATLNFLGLGVQPPSPNWGVMVAESRAIIAIAPIAALAPALAIGMTSVGISLIADAATQRFGLEQESEFLR